MVKMQEKHVRNVFFGNNAFPFYLKTTKQNRINNSLFSLTISDYELMCGNNVITKMMSKVLDCDERQLKNSANI